eukprot:EG_transcript_35701
MICRGTVRKWIEDKGFGFISPADGSEDVFVHQTEVKAQGFRRLQEGEQVEYQLTDDNGRRKATNVTGPGGAPVPGGGGKGKGKGGKGSVRGKGFATQPGLPNITSPNVFFQNPALSSNVAPQGQPFYATPAGQNNSGPSIYIPPNAPHRPTPSWNQ